MAYIGFLQNLFNIFIDIHLRFDQLWMDATKYNQVIVVRQIFERLYRNIKSLIVVQKAERPDQLCIGGNFRQYRKGCPRWGCANLGCVCGIEIGKGMIEEVQNSK